MAEKKHWLDVAAFAIAVTSLVIAGATALNNILIHRDDLRFVPGEALAVMRDDQGVVLTPKQELTFINAGNRPAIIHEVYAELVLVLDPKEQCNNRFAKSIVLNPTQIVLKPGEIVPLQATVAERYPWKPDKENKDLLRFSESKEEQAASYLVCLQLFVTTPDNASVRWMAALYSLKPGDVLGSKLFREDAPLKIIQRTSFGFGG
ncbi:hypothetical protein AFEL58S_01620 [Afipia felis]